MSGAPEVWASAVSSWAMAQPDITALVQIGSRVQKGGRADEWSDFDYHLVTTSPRRYRDGAFARAIAPCWVSGVQLAFGSAVKVSAVYEGALEADFVVLSDLEVRVATAAMGLPGTRWLWPGPLRRGVDSFRIVAAPGWRVIKGGAAWERRYARVTPLRSVLGEEEFRELCGEFWTQLVWAAKKAARGEYRASQRALHVHLLENCMRLLQEEALLSGRGAFPLSRRAEGWLTKAQAEGTGFTSAPDAPTLFAALESVSGAFSASAAEVARLRGWRADAPAQVGPWLGALRLSSTGKARQ